MKIAVAYVRRSKKSEAGVVSLDAQCDAIYAYIMRNGWKVGGIIRHDGISGTKRGRFDEIRKMVEDTGASVLVVYNLDRLARDSAGLVDYLRDCARGGIEVHESTSGRLDFKRSLGKLVVSVRGAMDQFYAEVIGEKTTDALKFLKDAGQQYTGIPPLGYQYVDGKMVAEPEEQRALQLIVHAKSHGFGRHRTLRLLRTHGYTGRGGLSTIDRLLRLPTEALKQVTDPENAPQKDEENQGVSEGQNGRMGQGPQPGAAR